MKLQKLTSQSRITEIDSTVKQIIEAYQKSSWEAEPYLPTLFDELKEHSLALSASINRTKAESSLDEKDEIRDNLVRGISYMLNGFCFHPVTEVQEAAKGLLVVFEKYGVAIISESYATESSLINALLADLSETAMVEATAKLSGFAELVENLKVAQKEFEAAQLLWEEEKAEPTKSATELKKDLLATLNGKIVLYLQGMVVVDSAKYGELGRIVAQIIESANQTVKRR